MIDAPLAYAFGVGMVATFNPCGFAMLPAYVSYFLGLEADQPAGPGTLRALAVGATMTAGFLAVFGLIGIVLTPLRDAIQEHLPWVTIVLGIGLVVMGVAMLCGRTFTVNLPKAKAGPRSRELWSVFLFGVSYALVSLFIAVVSTTFDDANLVSGMAVFVAYGLGMGLVLMALTLAIATARQGLVRNMRRILPWVHAISGVLLVLAGAYVTYYGWFELRVQQGDTSGGAVADGAFDLNARVSNWIQEVGPVRVGLVLALVIAAVTTVSLARRTRAARDRSSSTA